MLHRIHSCSSWFFCIGFTMLIATITNISISAAADGSIKFCTTSEISLPSECLGCGRQHLLWHEFLDAYHRYQSRVKKSWHSAQPLPFSNMNLQQQWLAHNENTCHRNAGTLDSSMHAQNQYNSKHIPLQVSLDAKALLKPSVQV